MEEYRAYVIGPDGHIINRVDIRCPDEKEARRLAKIAVDGHAVELWQTDRFIERFEPEQTRKTGAVDPQANSTGAPPRPYPASLR
jgi:hypothetical protein